MSAVKRITGLFDRVRSPLSKISNQGSSPKEEDLIQSVILRIEVEGEDHLDASPQADPEATYRRLMKRLEWQLKNSGVTVEELIRTFPREVRALLLYKSYEKGKKKRGEPTAARERLIELGFKSIQPGLWVLPPLKTPSNLNSQDELRMWFRQNIAKKMARSVDFVFPFIASVDLKRLVSERRGIRKMPVARTLYNVFSEEEVVPPSHMYAALRSRGMSVKEIILSGSVPFLCSAFADREDLEGIQANVLEVESRLRRATGLKNVSLEDIANLGSETVAAALKGFVAHPKDLAQRTIVEAQFWMRTLGGTVPT
ncbi:MAG: hypothetical protein KGI38_04565 [Thaumarchaeota archaeon]|nr:hypothetical protein [Nitrososphaerota archaeon]